MSTAIAWSFLGLHAGYSQDPISVMESEGSNEDVGPTLFDQNRGEPEPHLDTKAYSVFNRHV